MTSPLRSLTLVLLCAWPAAAHPDPAAIGSGRGGLAPALEGRDAASPGRPEVDATIARAIGRARAGAHDEAVEALRAAVHRTSLRDAKARYFLARAYLERAKARQGADPRGAREDRAAALYHLRAVPDLARRSPYEEDASWAEHARAQLRARSRATPRLDQYAAGRHPWGYCGPTSLRMVLRLEGLTDPGADAVALGGAAPYTPGSGSDPARLAARATELGLTGAAFTSRGRLADVAASLGAGRPVMVAGEGPFSATLEGGGRKQRSYPAGHWLVAVGHEVDAEGRVTRIDLNDPDGGLRLSMTRAEFLRFFAPEGDGHVWMIRYTR